MTTSRGYVNEINFNNLDDMQPPMRRFSPIELRSDKHVYQNQETRNADRYQTPKSERSGFCSKRCLIGLGIGLAIGVVLVIVIAVPIGVTKTCGVGTISSTPNWIGTYQMDNACSASSGSASCCCFTNQITLTQITGNQMQLTGSVTGQCSGVSSPVTETVSMPTGFQTYFIWGGETILLLLGQDNAFLAIVNSGTGSCSATAVRTSYNGASIKSMNLVMIMFILLITIGIMK